MYSISRSGRRCPRCGDDAVRVPRRFVDRVISLFGQVHRYRCDNPACGWEGNVRVKGSAPSKD